jgi:hypothetical protein
LFSEDVAMAGVTSEILDQEQVDKPQADIAGAGVRPGVVELEVSGDHAGTLAGTLKLGDHVGQRFTVGDNETAVVTGGVAVAGGLVQAEQGALEPDALGGGGVFDQPDRGGQ